MKAYYYIILVAAALSSCSEVKKPIFQDVEQVKLGKLGLTETTLSASLKFFNQNSYAFKVKSIDCNIYVDSVLLGHFNNAASVTAPRKDTFSLPVTGQVQTLLLIQQSRLAIEGKESFIRVEGSARVGRSGIYKTLPFTFRDTLVLKL